VTANSHSEARPVARVTRLVGVDVGMACVQRVDHGEDKPLTLAECIEQVTHPLTGLTRAELVETVAYLSAQVVGYRHSQDRDATLALQVITSAVREYERAAGRTTVEEPVRG
jgi:hypothetical protein